MLKPLFVLLCLILIGCEPLPTRITVYQSPRPVEPLPYEKKGYLLVQPTPSLPPAMQFKTPRTITAKPGDKLSQEDLATLLAQAEDKAIGAENLARTAQSKEDWSVVIDRWKLAIKILKPVAQLDRVRKQISLYERNLATAQTQAKTNPRQLAETERSTSNGIPLTIASPEPPKPSPAPSASPSPTASPAPTQ